LSAQQVLQIEASALTLDSAGGIRSAHREVVAMKRRSVNLVVGIAVLIAGCLASSTVVTDPAGAAATTLFVSAAGSDANPCSDSAPCSTISHALLVGGSASIIEVAGTIHDNPIVSVTATIEQWPGHAAATVKNGGFGTVFVVVFGGNLTLQGLSVTGGVGTVVLYGSRLAGGIANLSGTTTITDCTITGNTGGENGGGVLNTGPGTLTITDSTITRNTAAAGGGIDNLAEGNLTITDSTISNNSETSLGNGFGGGIEDTGSLTITDSTISNNSATALGGNAEGAGIDDRGVATITDSTISDNSTSATASGGIAGGGGFGGVGNLTITDSTISNNSVSAPTGQALGGGIADPGLITITDSTISNNSASAPAIGDIAAGGGIFEERVGNLVGATIVAANTANGTLNNCSGPFSSVGYNLTDDATGGGCGFTQGTDKFNAAPDLGPPAANGGPTLTMLPAINSPAVGVIPSPLSLNGVAVCGPGASDQRGEPRFAWCTIGAVEVSSASLSGGARFAAMPSGSGYWIVQADGEVSSYGAARLLGSLPELGIHVSNIVGIAVTPDGNGYWLVGSDGGVFAFGDATYAGSMGGKALNKPMVAMAASPDGRGYWLVASDGGVFSFGDANFAGSMGGRPLNAPMVAMAADPVGGYWLVASDGGLFSFGGAPFMGSMGGTPLMQPVVGVTSAPAGSGYWLVASDGGVFTFGRVPFAGSLGGSPLSIIGLFSINSGQGYTLVEASGTAHLF
jgi:hypothetical protein